MKRYPNTQGTKRPESVVIDAYTVWVATNVKEIEITDTETEETRTEYKYDLTQYEKDEYIKLKLAEQEEGILELADLIGGML